MRIVFVFPREQAYNSQSVRQKACGGTEKAVIYLGEALAELGHEIEWVTTLDQLEQPIAAPDAVITQEAELLQRFPHTKKIWWLHHFADQPVIQRNSGYGRVFADKIVTLSQCQADEFRQALRLDSVTIGHGVWVDELYTPAKDPYRLIYASTPFRGLERIPAIFSAIKAKEPRATIAIASSMGTYGLHEQDAKYKPLFDRLAAMDGVEMLGALNQEQLYSEYSKSSVFLYPCTWRETYCLALDEAVAHSCIPVTSGLAALAERFQYLMPAPTSDEHFASRVLGVFSEPDAFRPSDKPMNWTDIALRWEREVLQCP